LDDGDERQTNRVPVAAVATGQSGSAEMALRARSRRGGPGRASSKPARRGGRSSRRISVTAV
jgi:hypothetical protein